MAARKRTYQTEKTREKIQATQIVNRLQAAFEGKEELTSTQVKIGLGLLAKVLPDMTHQMIETPQDELSGEQSFMQLVNKVGEETARKLYPDMADKYLDHKPAQVLQIVK